MANERTMVTRWKSVVDPSVKSAANAAGDASEAAAKRSTAAWTAVGTAVGAFASSALEKIAEKAAEFAGDSLRAASDLKESVNVTQLTFGKYAPKMEAFYKSANTALGMSETAAREASASVGGLLQNMGLGKKASVDWSEKLLKMASDMGSAFNTDPADAIEAIGAGLRGESEPLRRYNVMLSDAALKQEAMSLGLYKGKGNLDNAAKAQAALALITKQTARVQGDFTNTATGAANASRIQAAKVEDLKAKFANSLLPAQEAVLAFTNDKLLPGMAALFDGMKGGIGWIQQNSNALTGIGIVVGILAGGYLALAAAQGISAAAAAAQAAGGIVGFIKAWAAQQAILNVIMSANPIAIVVIAIAALVAGIIYAYNNCKEFRRVVDTAFKAIAAAGKWLWNNALQPVIKFIVNGFAWIVDGVAGFLEMLGHIPGFGWANDAAKSLRGVATSARSAADGIKAIPDEKSTAISAFTSGSDKVSALQTQIEALKDKQVTAKANGDTAGVDKLQKKIDDLKDKKIQLEAQVKKGTVIARTEMKAGKDGVMKFTALANGGILGVKRSLAVKRFANGAENHVAQIAAAGAMRLWAEPETGGEGYLPLAPAKRSRTIPMWWEIGRRLGVVRYANGGVTGGAGAPSGSLDDLIGLLQQLLGRLMTRDDLQTLLDVLRQAPSGPRPAVRLGS